jgi:GTPase SAR1 family protein
LPPPDVSPDTTLDAPKKRGRKKADAGMVQDEKLFTYFTKILGEADKTAAPKSLKYESVSPFDLRVEGKTEDLEKYGFFSEIVFDNGTLRLESRDRLCPNCHNLLPVGYGLRDTILISIIGDARAGKSVYLTMLISELENNRDFPSKLSFIGDEGTRELIYANYQKPLLEERILIDSTKRKRLPPFSYNYWYKYRDASGELRENTIDIIFYDIAGEDMRDGSSIQRNGFNIRDSSGLIFLLDPTNFRSLKDVFMLRDRDIIDAIPSENSIQRVFSAMFNYFIGMDKDKSSIPLALTISKVDLFSFAELDFFSNRPHSRMQSELEGENFDGFIDLRLNRGINLEVKELLSYLNEDSVIHNASGCFKHMSCFAVSSLGRKPITEKISDPLTNETIERGYVDGEPEPFRVKDPFYWILLKNDLLYCGEASEYRRVGSKPAQAVNAPLGPIEKLLMMLRGLFN